MKQMYVLSWSKRSCGKEEKKKLDIKGSINLIECIVQVHTLNQHVKIARYIFWNISNN